jgi:HAE1 family hydrophobic/amphiphilic exporter-1
VSVSALFIRRPVTTTLVMLGLLLFGIMGYFSLPVSDLPNVDFPTIQVTGELPGADPETMASAVATPLEREFSTIAGIDSMTSSSTLGMTRITIQFSLERSIDAAALDVQSAISKAGKQLPQNMTTPPYFRKVNPADQPVLYFSLSSATLPLSQVNEYADTLLAQRISMVGGVSQVNIYGEKKYAVRVQADPKALATRQIGINEVATAIAKGNVNLPTGTLYGEHSALNVQADGQLFNAAAYRPLIVAWRNGAPVRLSDIGQVFDSVENDKLAAWNQDQRTIILAIQKQPGSNTVEVVDNILKLLPIFRSQLPASVRLEQLYDRSQTIRESVDDVKFTLALTVCLVVLVIFLFLRNVRATVIPSLALPMSVVATFAVMHALGYSLDNLSLMALTLAVGFVVDDAIVMLENIHRHVEMGKPVRKAAFDGAAEIGFTIVSMTISLAAVFIPVLFMGGIVGRLFREFSMVIIVAILISGFVSLSLTPMLCALFLKPHGEERHGRIYRASERVFDGMLAGYRWSLGLAVKHHVITFVFSLLLIAATGWLFNKLPKGFIPSEDTGRIVITTEADQSVSFDAMVRRQFRLQEVVAAEPAVRTYNSTVGAGGPNAAGNTGRLNLFLKPRHQRELSADQLIEKLRPKLNQFPGIQAYLINPPVINLGGRISKSLYQFTIQNPDTKELYQYATVMEEQIRKLPMVQDVTSDLQLKNPEVNLVINRDKAAALGLSAYLIEEALQSSFGARQVSTIYAPTNSYKVILELLPEYQRDQSALSLLYVRAEDGRLVSLDTVTTRAQTVGPLSLNHSGQLPSVTVSFNLKPGAAIGDAVAAIQAISRETLPPTCNAQFQGTAQAFQASFKGMLVLLIMAVLVIYIVLGILYESFIHPLTILSGLPSAGFGALLTLMVFKVDLSLYAIVGVIMLIGIVKKNAIMMIDFAVEAERKHGKSPAEAIFEGCLIRFRPIMMTTMAALVGALPIAIGFGAGSEARRPLGLAVVGGLLVSQCITLYITPVYYVYLDAVSLWLRRSFGRAPEEPAVEQE